MSGDEVARRYHVSAALDHLRAAAKVGTGRSPRPRCYPPDAVDALREAVMQLEIEVHRLVLSGEAANDDPATAVRTEAVRVTDAVTRVENSVRTWQARRRPLPSSARDMGPIDRNTNLGEHE